MMLGSQHTSTKSRVWYIQISGEKQESQKRLSMASLPSYPPGFRPAAGERHGAPRSGRSSPHLDLNEICNEMCFRDPIPAVKGTKLHWIIIQERTPVTHSEESKPRLAVPLVSLGHFRPRFLGIRQTTVSRHDGASSQGENTWKKQHSPFKPGHRSGLSPLSVGTQSHREGRLDLTSSSSDDNSWWSTPQKPPPVLLLQTFWTSFSLRHLSLKG